MLDLFRKRGLTSVVYGVIIVATIFVFVINFRPNANQKSASLRQACVATVKGFCIDPKTHRAAYSMLMPRDQAGNRLTERAKSMGLNKIALDGLIERELLVSEADRLGLTVSEDEENNAVIGGFIYVSVPMENARMPMQLRVPDGTIYAGFKDQKTKQFDMKVYERAVKVYTDRSPTEFKEWQSREILAAKMRDLVRAPIRVADAEAFNLYVTEKTSATVTYIPVRFDWAENYMVNATPAAVAEWMKDKSNADQAKDSNIRHILIKTDADAGADSKEAARKKAEDLIAKIKGGADFEKLAKEFSADPGSAVNGGSLQTSKTDGFVKPFKDGADALKSGEMTSTPIESQFGFHIIKKDDASITAYKKAKGLEAAKDLANQIRAAIKGGQSPEDAVKAAIAPFIKPVKVADKPANKDGDAGAPAPTETPKTADTDPSKPEVDTSSAFNRGGEAIPSLSPDANGEIGKLAFGDSKEGAMLAEPLRTQDGFYVVILKTMKAATREEFDKEHETYVQGLLAAKQAEALSLYVRRLRETAKPDIKIDDTFLTDATSKGDGGAPAPIEEEDEGP